MKVIRFVTEAELAVYLSGGKLMNANNHNQLGRATTSVGFCFAELTEERTPEKWLYKLMGIRPCEICLEFDTDNFKTPLTESRATYADDKDLSKTIEIREWCTTQYSLDTHPCRRIGLCANFYDIITIAALKSSSKKLITWHTFEDFKNILEGPLAE